MRSADAITADWVSRMGQSGQKITDGVNAVTVSPGQAAARQVKVWVANTIAAEAKFATNVGKVSLQAWKDDMINKGIGRIAQGAQSAAPKFQAFMTKLIPHIQAGQAKLKPRGDFGTNVQRMNDFVNHMHSFRNA